MNLYNNNHYNIEDIVFENRNKLYGAYALRKNYDDNMAKGMLVGFLFISFIFLIPTLFKYFRSEVTIECPIINDEEIITIVETYYEPEQPKPIEKTVKKAAVEVAQVKYVNLDIKRDDEVVVEELLPTNIDVKDRIISTINSDGVKSTLDLPKIIIENNPTGNGDNTEISTVKNPNAVFKFVQYKPQFPGGDEALLKYLNANIKYPQIAIENKIEGTVVIKFTVTKNGDIADVNIIRQIGGGCEKEAVRVVNQMPKWKPGIHNNKAVNCYYTLPVKFELE